MLPIVYEFQWTAGHLIFLGAFFSVVFIIASTLGMALWRAERNRDRKSVV